MVRAEIFCVMKLLWIVLMQIILKLKKRYKDYNPIAILRVVNDKLWSIGKKPNKYHFAYLPKNFGYEILQKKFF